jgi:hypothetical protein
VQLECSNSIRGRDVKEHLRLGIVKTLYEAHGQIRPRDYEANNEVFCQD